MGGVLAQFIPLMIGAAITPVWIFLTLLILRSEGGLFKASAFAGGQILVRIGQGLAFRYASGASSMLEVTERAPTMVNTLFLVAGILLWITALKIWNKEEDPDAPPPKWMAMCESLSTPKTFAFSAVLMVLSGKQWIFTFGALCVIRETDLSRLHSAIAFLVFALGAQSLLLTPIVVYVTAPKHAPRLLEASIQWLERYNQKVIMVVSVLLGTVFIFEGITGLRE